MEPTKKRILFLHPSAELYGADRTLIDLVTGLDREEFHAVVAVPEPGPLCEALQSEGIEVYQGPLGVAAMGSLSIKGLLGLAWQLPKSLLFVRRIVKSFRPHVIHTNTMVVLGGALGAKLSHAKHVWHIHEIPTKPKWLAQFTGRLLTFLADQVVWNSHATAQTFLRHERRLGSKALVIHNGIQNDRVQPLIDKDQARKRLGWPKDIPIAMVIGRINAWKGQRLAVEALSLLKEQHPTLRLAIVGGTPPGQEHFVKELLQHAAKLDIRERILLHGFDDQVGRYFSACDFVVVPSTRPEPFGLVVLEAFQSGRPVITSAHGGPMEIVQPGQNGAWVEPNNARDLAECMDRWVRRPKSVEFLGRRAKKRQSMHFSMRTHVQRFARLYHLLDSGPVDHRYSSGSQKPAEIIHVVLGKANPARMNGVNRFVHGLATAQSSLGPTEVWGLCRDPEAPTPPRAYRLVTFPRKRNRWRLCPGVLGNLDRLLQLKKENRPVFHLHGAFLPEMAAFAKELRMRNLAYVFTPHGAYVPLALQKNRFLKALYRRVWDRRLVNGSRAVQVLSLDEQDAFEQRFPDTRVLRFAPGQSTAGGGQNQERLRRGMRLQVGSLGRLDMHTKGLDILLRAVALYTKDGGHVHLTIAGDGPDRQALERLAQALNITEQVTWKGEIHGQQKTEFFGGVDLLVQASRHEGLPGVPLEAAAAGRPVIISQATHLGEMVRRFDCGLVLEELTPECLADAMLRASLLSAKDWERWVQGAETMIRDEFSWDKRAASMRIRFYGLSSKVGPHSSTGEALPEAA